ncbi:unnamed protein product [Fusarium graminearum]|uniref:Atos-like conserved domain-containing protein n=1 Tax=Gibberella zeae TaxID=5518 RepID=A0A2H3G5W4_GIBZA|nr:hypothetical protein FG05_06195 [Fusarium graminearum]KAI6751566.1 hypothetical protein HG531_006262 [Fusarium graminearum]PCD19212.1 hypothetical protein FGRA07_06017 [Fusarium graminearum]CAF3484505.1 unnamed protein product [Fusarium graminearum]CAF3553292.1 unnamed protein product [Fusarium graminearum]
MPIFQADLDNHEPEPKPEHIEPSPINLPSSGLRRLSEESIRTELCEGLVPDSPPRSKTPHEVEGAENAISDRASLIERLKRAQSPPICIPNRHLESAVQHQTSDIETKHPQTPTEPSTLLAPAQITPDKTDSYSDFDSRLRDGLSIERPRSALHSGNFSEEEAVTKDHTTPVAKAHNGRYPAPETPWIATSPPRHFTPFQHDKGVPFPASAESFRSTNSPLSSSLSSSFIYKPPTSPLVQAQSSEEHDMSLPRDPFSFAGYVGAGHYTPRSTASSPWMSPSPKYSLPQRVSSYRREAFLYQAHQPRRSLTSTPSFMQPGASPPTPALFRPRRSSVAAEASPLQHASMVGSYEESILRGRMSTTPSKPLDFVAQIGVLGKGKCKSSLKCPPHVSLSFPAVYYSYSSTSHGRSNSDDGPSPYVGQIDLENGLSNPDDDHRAKKKAQSRYAERRPAEDIMDTGLENQASENLSRRNSRASRRSGSGSAKAPPGGSYRIPEKGQIQIIIKNPNKTAVKLFLVPYDLTGMEPGTKTFVRQRSYSAGPIIDHAPTTAEANTDDRPILRYLAHLHICCPAKGRYYLYKSIRIVFANRVPDGKEKLRNETTWPEPRYTPYKPIRVMHPPLPTQSGPAAMLAADKASRRRSVGFFPGSSHNFDAMDNMFRTNDSPSGGSAGGNTLPVDPIPFYLPGHARSSSDVSNSTNTTVAIGNDSRFPGESQSSRPSTKDSSNDQSAGPALYEKLNKGEPGYGGNAFALNRRGSISGAEGLLSQRLRSLGVKQPSPPETPRQGDMSP